MERIIEAPSEEEFTYIARMWIFGNQLAKDIIGKELVRSNSDLEMIQEILDKDVLTKNDNDQLHALGIVFGQVYVNDVAGYDWWMVEDEYGRDVSLRYKETSLLIFPQTMLSNRIEDDETFRVNELYHDLVSDMEKIRLEHYENA